MIGHARPRSSGFANTSRRQEPVDERADPLLRRRPSAADQRRQAQCSHDRRRGFDRTEVEPRQQPEEAGHRAVALDQLRPPLGVVVAVVRRGSACRSCSSATVSSSRGTTCSIADHAAPARPPRRRRAVGIPNSTPSARATSPPPGAAPAARRACLLARALRLRQQLGRHQQIEQVQRVVDRVDLQLADRRQQRRRPPGGLKLTQRRRLRGKPIAGEARHLRRRHVRQLDLAGAQRAYLKRALKRSLQSPARDALAGP